MNFLSPPFCDILIPQGSDDFDFVSEKIVDGLDAEGMIKNYDLDKEEGLAA